MNESRCELITDSGVPYPRIYRIAPLESEQKELGLHSDSYAIWNDKTGTARIYLRGRYRGRKTIPAVIQRQGMGAVGIWYVFELAKRAEKERKG